MFIAEKSWAYFDMEVLQRFQMRKIPLLSNPGAD
jgi:hypothetical protein